MKHRGAVSRAELMRQHRLGDVGAGLCVVDEKILAPLHHCRELIERHKSEGAGIIEAPVRVFLDDGGAVRICHRHTWNPTALPRDLEAIYRTKGKHST
jgi:hypothetical protein